MMYNKRTIIEDHLAFREIHGDKGHFKILSIMFIFCILEQRYTIIDVRLIELAIVGRFHILNYISVLVEMHR